MAVDGGLMDIRNNLLLFWHQNFFSPWLGWLTLTSLADNFLLSEHLGSFQPALCVGTVFNDLQLEWLRERGKTRM